jgi:hypothetical protein
MRRAAERRETLRRVRDNIHQLIPPSRVEGQRIAVVDGTMPPDRCMRPARGTSIGDSRWLVHVHAWSRLHSSRCRLLSTIDYASGMPSATCGVRVLGLRVTRR